MSDIEENGSKLDEILQNFECFWRAFNIANMQAKHKLHIHKELFVIGKKNKAKYRSQKCIPRIGSLPIKHMIY
jgi:hypothetical protein